LVATHKYNGKKIWVLQLSTHKKRARSRAKLVCTMKRYSNKQVFSRHLKFTCGNNWEKIKVIGGKGKSMT
jgi:hypothetical protein